MADEPVLRYRNCLTCSRPIPLQEGSEQVYCSPECARENLLCPVCGRYYEKGTGVTAPWGVEVCGPACAETDDRYNALFKENS